MTGEAEFAVARELYDAAFAGDTARVEAVLAEHAEWHNPPEAIEPGIRRGRAAFMGAIGRIQDTWDFSDLRLDYFDAGHEVGVDLRVEVSGRGSGLKLPGHFRHYLVIRDGRVVRLRWEALPD